MCSPSCATAAASRTGRLAAVTNAGLVAHMVRAIGRSALPVARAGALVTCPRRDGHSAAPPVVSQASFTLRRGEILGIAGLMGSGRTEMVRALFGLAPGGVRHGAHCGRDGRSCRDALAAHRAACRIPRARTARARGSRMPMSVADNLTMTGFSASCQPRLVETCRSSAAPRGAGSATSGSRRTAAGPARADPVGRQPAESGARTAAVPGRRRAAARRADARRRTSAARRRSTRPSPTAASSGKAVLMISSYLPELFGLCDQLAVMSRGRLVRRCARSASGRRNVCTRRLTRPSADDAGSKRRS